LRPTRITRLLRVEAHEPSTRWQHAVGLSALLEAARHLSPRDPWELPDLDGATGMAKLLKEAREWGQEKRHEA
jgi:hypothetical protein